jgi:hypothetical protein
MPPPCRPTGGRGTRGIAPARPCAPLRGDSN